jgi:hypothetical protein
MPTKATKASDRNYAASLFRFIRCDQAMIAAIREDLRDDPHLDFDTRSMLMDELELRRMRIRQTREALQELEY